MRPPARALRRGQAAMFFIFRSGPPYKAGRFRLAFRPPISAAPALPAARRLPPLPPCFPPANFRRSRRAFRPSASASAAPIILARDIYNIINRQAAAVRTKKIPLRRKWFAPQGGQKTKKINVWRCRPYLRDRRLRTRRSARRAACRRERRGSFSAQVLPFPPENI